MHNPDVLGFAEMNKLIITMYKNYVEYSHIDLFRFSD